MDAIAVPERAREVGTREILSNRLGKARMPA
jgi:hypothetical protein